MRKHKGKSREKSREKRRIEGGREKGNGGKGQGEEGPWLLLWYSTNRLVGLCSTLVTSVGGHCHHRFDLCCPGNDPSYSNQLPDAVRLHFAN